MGPGDPWGDASAAVTVGENNGKLEEHICLDYFKLILTSKM